MTPVYNALMFVLLHGPDDFSAREALARLREQFDFGANQDTFAGSDTTLAELRAVADTYPFLSERRLVVLDGLPQRKRKQESGDSAAGGEAKDAPVEQTPARTSRRTTKRKSTEADPRVFARELADYAGEIPETTVIVVLCDEILESDAPLVQAAKKHGNAQVFAPPRGAALEQWAIQRAGARDATLRPEAARLLISELGDDLRLLAQEIDKLCTYVGRDGAVGEQEVRLLTPSTRVSRVFDLTDALSRRDRKRALALLHELLEAGESPLGIVAMTAYQTRALLQIKTLAERGLRAPQIAQAAGLAPYVVDKSIPLARQLTFPQLEAAHRSLLEIDQGLKLSRLTPELALDLLVVEFAREGGR